MINRRNKAILWNERQRLRLEFTLVITTWKKRNIDDSKHLNDASLSFPYRSLSFLWWWSIPQFESEIPSFKLPWDQKKPEIKIYCELSLSIQKDTASDISNQSLKEPRYPLTTCRDISIGEPSLVIGRSPYFDLEVVLQPYDCTKESEVDDVKRKKKYYSKCRIAKKE
jgi:hypothetical protein